LSSKKLEQHFAFFTLADFSSVFLILATARQDVDELLILLQSGKYNPNTVNEDGLTPIHQCSIDNSDKILQLLIEYGGDVNAKDRDFWTPLHAAGI
jgi:ankyrin repeat protein